LDKNFKISHKSAIVIFNYGAFGGAPKRYTQLFLNLNKLFPGKFYFITNNHLFEQISAIFTDLPLEQIKLIDFKKEQKRDTLTKPSSTPTFFPGNIPDPMEIDKNTSILRKIYWYYKNKFRQKSLYKQIENYRKELGIRVFIGVFGGINPLVFYLDEKPRKASVIFSDMDSWFSEVHPDMKKLWYRKYYSFNYAMENSDYVDFLSPYILEGVRKRNVKIKEGTAMIAPCSFIDYSKCRIGDKKKFEAAFCARLEPDKNPMLYLEAAKEIINKYPGVKFHILGEGTLVNEIRNFIESHNLAENINFQFHRNPPDILANTSAFVSIQSNTNYPSQSVLEAMACGNAIIASSTGDTQLFINSNNGLLIELTKENLVAALEKLINDKALTAGLGNYAREYAMSNHTEEKYIEYFLDLSEKAYKKNFG
jgi:glycosyltransferase involved in cell wall biosynthesis